jgi:hypothetical protein
MGITDELRKWGYGFCGSSYEAVNAIADRIDAEHERQLEVLYRDMSDAEYVKLPKDTGSEYIHERDKVDWRDHAGTWHENATVVAVCNDGCYVMDGIAFHVHKSDIRHHPEPTVEDVLREFVSEFNRDDTELCDEEIIERFAAKLRLSDDGEWQ